MPPSAWQNQRAIFANSSQKVSADGNCASRGNDLMPQMPSTRAMQDCMRPALLHFLQQLTDFDNDLYSAPFRLRSHFVH